MSKVRVRFCVKLSDYDAFKAAIRKINYFGPDFEFSDEDYWDDSVELKEDEVSDGGHDQIQQLVKDTDCPPFSYNHDEGAEFDAQMGVFIAGRHLTVTRSIADESPLLPVNLHAPNNYDDLAEFFLFLELDEEFNKYCSARQQEVA